MSSQNLKKLSNTLATSQTSFPCATRGATILISSHILTELEGFCTSIGIMQKGRLVRSGRIEEVTAMENLGRTIHLGWVGDSAATVRSLLGGRAHITDSQFNTNEGTFQFAGGNDELAEV